MGETNFDIAVIGAGPGGYVAAIRAVQLGLKTVIIEREHLGGICLNWACIPTKALLRTELYHLMRRASEFGLAADNIRFDLARVVERSRKVAARLANGVAYLMQKNKIAVVDGTATLQGQGNDRGQGQGRAAAPRDRGQAYRDRDRRPGEGAAWARARRQAGLDL
jgi:dihydrolipoamide dehydrogenase